MIPEKFEEFAIKYIQYLLKEISNITLRSKVFLPEEWSLSILKRLIIVLNSAFLPVKPQKHDYKTLH